MRGKCFALVLLVALAAACGSEAELPTPREELEAAAEQAWGASDTGLMLGERPIPSALPPGWELWGRVSARPLWEMMFIAEEAEDHPIVALCTVPKGEPMRGTCLPLEQQVDHVVTETPDYTIVVTSLRVGTSAAALDAWRDVTYTTDWSSVAWLDEPPR